eukprot:7777250-Pyramimonas_sp.AAC.1
MGRLSIHTIALNVYHAALSIHTISLNVYHVALSIHTIALNVCPVALSIHTIALNGAGGMVRAQWASPAPGPASLRAPVWTSPTPRRARRARQCSPSPR